MGHSDFKSEVNVLASFCITEVFKCNNNIKYHNNILEKIKRQVCLVADVVGSVLSA